MTRVHDYDHHGATGAPGMRADQSARGQHPGHSGHARVERRERRNRVRGARRVVPGQLGSPLDEHDEYQLHLDRESWPAVRARTVEVQRAVWQLVERSGIHRRQLGQTRRAAKY